MTAPSQKGDELQTLGAHRRGDASHVRTLLSTAFGSRRTVRSWSGRTRTRRGDSDRRGGEIRTARGGSRRWPWRFPRCARAQRGVRGLREKVRRTAEDPVAGSSRAIASRTESTDSDSHGSKPDESLPRTYLTAVRERTHAELHRPAEGDTGCIHHPSAADTVSARTEDARTGQHRELSSVWKRTYTELPGSRNVPEVRTLTQEGPSIPSTRPEGCGSTSSMVDVGVPLPVRPIASPASPAPRTMALPRGNPRVCSDRGAVSRHCGYGSFHGSTIVHVETDETAGIAARGVLDVRPASRLGRERAGARSVDPSPALEGGYFSQG